MDTRFSKFAPSVHEGDTEYDEDTEELSNVFSDGADEVLNMLRKMSGTDLPAETSDHTSHPESTSGQNTDIKKAPVTQTACQLFTFTSLKDVTRLAHVASASYQGINSLYKDERKGSYLLMIDSTGQDASSFNRICNLITEYGKPERSVLSAKAYLEEHCEPLIRDNALASLAQI